MFATTCIKVTGTLDWDDEAVASLLRDVKTIAEKEVQVDPVAKSNLPDRSPLTGQNVPICPVLRGRSISFGTEELTRDLPATTTASSLQPISTARQPKPFVPDLIEHHDWSNHVGSYKESSFQGTTKKQGKRKDDSFVGQMPRSLVRATLRRKFSWKQYPEVRRSLRLIVLDWLEDLANTFLVAGAVFVEEKESLF